MEKKKIKKISAGKVAAIGAGVAVVGAGAYYLLGPKGKEHQKKIKGWMLTMKKEIDGEFKKAKNATTPVYHKTVDAIAKVYSQKHKEYSKEINAFAKTLKATPAVKKASKVVKKVSKAVTKKVA